MECHPLDGVAPAWWSTILVYLRLAWLVARLSCLPCRNWCNAITGNTIKQEQKEESASYAQQ
jgi:hypothetical protein